MRRLSSIIVLLWASLPMIAQSPHGEELKIDCGQCHNPQGWTVYLDDVTFDHNESTSFPLEGAHAQTDCRLCHESMILSEVPATCVDCHDDVHSMSVGNDCMRCHTSQSWLVDEIPELHEMNGFPLIGAHSTLSCVECHEAETNLRFDRIGNECVECHFDDYVATENPPHEAAGYSTECTQCHSPLGFDWSADPIGHDFFPLELGHDIQDCTACHTTASFSDASPDCVSCHQADFLATTNPRHIELGFSTDCKLCHTLEPGWAPARFDTHDDQYFPIYNGTHAGTWDACLECHPSPNDYSIFTCLTCHLKGPTDGEHDDVNGYVYESNACLECHPDGNE